MRSRTRSARVIVFSPRIAAETRVVTVPSLPDAEVWKRVTDFRRHARHEAVTDSLLTADAEERLRRRAPVLHFRAGMYKRSTTLALALATLLTVSCGSGGGGDFNLISIEEEWQLGAQLSQDIARQVRLSNDPTLNNYINQMGQKIVANTNMANLPWNFHELAPGHHFHLARQAENEALPDARGLEQAAVREHPVEPHALGLLQDVHADPECGQGREQVRPHEGGEVEPAVR